MAKSNTSFKPGTSGNPSGKAKLKPLTDRLRMILAQQPQRAHAIAEALVVEAEAGNLQAAQMIFDRLEGKPLQQVEVTDARQDSDIAEIDARIAALTRRLGLPSPSVIEAEVIDIDVDDSTKH
jgi:hypothetical protein